MVINQYLSNRNTGKDNNEESNQLINNLTDILKGR